MTDKSTDRRNASDPEKDAVILGEELRSATEAEERWKKQQDGEKPRLLDADYDYHRGELDLLNPTPSPLDEKVRALCQRYMKSDAQQRARMRKSLSMDEFYVLVFFGKRAAVFSLREGNPALVADGLAGLAMIERERIDFRDILMSLALLYHSASRVSEDPNKMFQDAAALAEPGVAKLFTNFTEGTPKYRSLRTSWGYDEVETTHGRGFMDWGFAEYHPTEDLAKIIVEIAAFIADDKYHPGSIEVAAELPPVWLQGGDKAEVTRVLSAVRGGASLSGSLRPGEHPDHDSQHFSVFLVETADPGDAQVLLRASRVKAPGHYKLGTMEGSLFCLIVARSFVEGKEAFESQDSLLRFSDGIATILKRNGK